MTASDLSKSILSRTDNKKSRLSPKQYAWLRSLVEREYPQAFDSVHSQREFYFDDFCVIVGNVNMGGSATLLKWK